MSDSIDNLDKYFDEISDSFEKLKSVIDKHPKETFRFFNKEGQGWVIEINVDLLGLPKETTMNSLYNTDSSIEVQSKWKKASRLLKTKLINF